MHRPSCKVIGGAVITRRRYPSANVARQAMLPYCGGGPRRPTGLLPGVARVTVGLAEAMAAYRRVYDSRHLQTDC